MLSTRVQSETFRVLFVGAFSKRPGVYGGQISACTSLMKTDFSTAFEIVQIDSTLQTLPPPAVWIRGAYAIGRLGGFIWHMLLRRPKAALIFVADGPSFFEKGLMAIIAKATGLRVVLAPRSGFLEEQYSRYPLMRRAIRRVFGAVDVIICQSQYWTEAFVRMGADPPSKCIVLKNWIDTSEFSEVPDLKEDVTPLRLCFLGWVDKSKGIFDLLTAIAVLCGRGRHITLEIGGAGSALESAKLRVQELGLSQNVHFSGWLAGAEKIRLFQEAHLLTLPSYAEGLPNAMLEAMAAGRPVIATTVGSIPDVLSGSGAGLLHAPGDVEGLIAAIEFYYSNRSELCKAGTRARLLVARQHSILHASRVLQECIKGPVTTCGCFSKDGDGISA